LFNATRFALMNGAAPAPLPGADAMTVADRWILGELAKTIKGVDTALEAYEFGRACDLLYRFAWNDFCDWYLELAKVQIANGQEHTRAVLAEVLDKLLKLLHPVMPFVTEVLWKAVTGGESLVVAQWPEAAEVQVTETDMHRVTNLQTLVTEIRRFRSDQGMKDRQKVPARIADAEGDPDIDLPTTFALTSLTTADDGFAATASLEVRLGHRTVVVEVDTSGTVDVAAERRRLEKDLAAAHKELAGTSAKLDNAAFLAKAPADVVEKITSRRQLAGAEVERITARLAALT
jgi:valyl-tRNA synthetase